MRKAADWSMIRGMHPSVEQKGESEETMQALALQSSEVVLLSVHGTCRRAHRMSQTLTSQCMLSRDWSSTTG